jgi:hypothetical protein
LDYDGQNHSFDAVVPNASSHPPASAVDLRFNHTSMQCCVQL